MISVSRVFRPIRIFLTQCFLIFTLFPGVYASGSSEQQRLRPDALISLSSDDGPGYAILVEKDTQSVLVYEYKDTFRLKHRFACSTGKVSGNKRESGDRKTPEGVYFFSKVYQKRELQPIYGNGAFVLDYPNLLDRKFDRAGNNIWLHGSNKPIKPRDSNGCVVMGNGDLEALVPYILLNRTPIILKQKLHMVRPESQRTDQKSLTEFLETWETAFVTGDRTKYSACYSEPSGDLDTLWGVWDQMRTTWQDAQIPFGMTLGNVTFLRGNPCVVALFDQVMHLDRHVSTVGTKKLFLEKDGNIWKIVGEVYQPAESNPSVSRPLVTALADLDRLHRDYEAIADLVAGWAEAWSSKDIIRYRACYAEDFRVRAMDIGAWIRYKESLNDRYAFIRVSTEDLKIRQGAERSTATFLQRYHSSGYQAVGIKHLHLKRIGGAWKIYRETWHRIQK